MQHSAVQHSAIQCNTVQHSATQCNAVQCNAVQCNAVQCNAVQCNTVQCNTGTILQPMAGVGSATYDLSCGALSVPRKNLLLPELMAPSRARRCSSRFKIGRQYLCGRRPLSKSAAHNTQS